MTIRELLIAIGFKVDDKKIKKADEGLTNLKNNAASVITTLGRAAAVVGLTIAAVDVARMADEWANVDARIGLVTKSAEEQASMQQKVYEIAQKTRQEYGATGDLYFKMARNAGTLKASQQDVLDVTETVNKALVVGGASTQEAQATILQFSQALASGRLQGDELRSLSENASVLMDEVARYYGVTVGKLKEMGKDGELTAEGIFQAVLKAKVKMDKEFEKMPVTIEQSVTYALNRIGSMIFGINKETGLFQSIAKGIMQAADWIADSIERATKLVGGFGNAIKLLIMSLAALKIAMFIFAHPLTYLPRLIVMLRGVMLAVAGVGKAMLGLLANPAFWKAALIAGTIMLIVLALEDLYYWITGGESVIGDFLGPWKDFKTKVITWINEITESIAAGFEKGIQFWKDVFTALEMWISQTWQSIKDTISGYVDAFSAYIAEKWNEIVSVGQMYFDILLAAWRFLIDQFSLALQFWTQIFTGDFSGAVETIKQYFSNLLTFALSVLSQIGGAIGRYVLSKLGWAGQKLAELTGINLTDGGPALQVADGMLNGQSPFSLSPSSFPATGGGNTVIINNTGDTQIEQNIAGTGPQIAAQVGAKTAEAADQSNDRMLRSIQGYTFAESF